MFVHCTNFFLQGDLFQSNMTRMTANVFNMFELAGHCKDGVVQGPASKPAPSSTRRQVLPWAATSGHKSLGGNEREGEFYF
jgi:hypothetical protein